MEAAEAVCNTTCDLGIELFEGLSSLVDKNLVHRVDRADTEPRFAMLETIREYALERLTDSGEQSATRRAHAAYCLVLAEEGNPDLSPTDRAGWLAQCDIEIDNFRFALDWLFQTRDLDWGLRFCVALFRFWDMREHLTEGRSRLETVLRLASGERCKERARVSQFLGALTTAQGDYVAAESISATEPVSLRRTGRRLGHCRVFERLGCIGTGSGRLRRWRRTILSEALRVGVCCRIGWQSRAVFTTCPMW